MSAPCVIQADYSNWRTVAGRKVLQLIFEVPIEQTADVMEKLGVPMPGESRWCAIARLENGKPASVNGAGEHGNAPRPSESTGSQEGHHGKTPSPTNANTAAVGTSETPSPERRKFASLPLSQQCAIRCQDKDFQQFLHLNYGMKEAEDTRLWVHKYCQIPSRAALDVRANDFAIQQWNRVEADYQARITTRQYGDSAR